MPSKMVVLLTFMFTMAHIASQVSALVPRTPLYGLLSHRATISPSEFPAQCQTICGPIITVLDSCAGLDCLCTAANAQSLLTCIDCDVSTDPTVAVIAQGQSVLDQFEAECLLIGVKVTPLSVSVVSGASATGTGTLSNFFALSSTAAAAAASPTQTSSGSGKTDPLSRSAATRTGGIECGAVGLVAIMSVVWLLL